MAKNSRLARLILPRFGFGWVFVGMLLVISAAGWWKFHRDLYVEEIEVLRALKANAGKVSVRRSHAVWFQWSDPEDFDGEIPWNAPLAPPVEEISVWGEIPDEVRDAARLPRLKSLGAGLDWAPADLSVDDPEPFDVEAHLGRSLPEMPDPSLSLESISLPLPEGDDIGDDEAARIADAIHSHWHGATAAAPSRYLVVSSIEALMRPVAYDGELHLVEPGRRFHYYAGAFSQRACLLRDGVGYDVQRYNGDAWRRQSRYVDATVQKDDEVFRRYPSDSFPYLSPDISPFWTISHAVDAMPAFEFARVAKVDDVRYRVDFRPFSATRGDAEILVTQWSLVLRSDMNWAPEESRIVQKMQQGKRNAPSQLERKLSQRFARDGEHVFLTERVAQDSSGPVGGVTVNDASRYLYVHEIDPQIDERIYDPLSLDPEPWPDRRELPWLRWYRVTFLFGCGLAVALIGRRLIPVKRAMASPDDEPSDDVPAPGGVTD